MAIAPLFVKYQTESRQRYVYDLTTNEIISIGEVAYSILDDFHVLSEDEIIEKYRSLGEEDVRKALRQLDKLQLQGILSDHAPETRGQIERIVCRGNEESLEEFLTSHRRLLILEITQQCNLRCEYCCYGEHYPERRVHKDVAMSLETAKSAVKDFLSHPECGGQICLYGGEPLLEFELLKQIVLFGEEVASQYGITPRFKVATNGTLLTDEKIHFLVSHNVGVAISLDGDKRSHDRYRVFRNRQGLETKIGSHDIVVRNIRRFVELYPDYRRRAISLTLTAQSDFDRINEFLKQFTTWFKSIAARFVGIPDKELQDGAIHPKCWNASCCEQGPCGHQCSPFENGDNGGHVATDLQKRDSSKEVPDFIDWTPERQHHLQSSYNQLLAQLPNCSNADDFLRKIPLFMAWIPFLVRLLHERQMPVIDGKHALRYVCLPGCHRVFCSADGDFYVCEKMETSSLRNIGSAERGVDPKRVQHLIELFWSLIDCSNCIAKGTCPVCYALLSEPVKDSGKHDFFSLREACQITINKNMPLTLKKYSETMEIKPEVFDDLFREEPDDWMNDLRIILREERINKLETGVEELQEVV